MPAGLDQVPDPSYFAALPVSGQLYPSPWALSGSDSHLHHSFCTQVMKTFTREKELRTTIAVIMERAIKKREREKEGLGPVQIVCAQ